MVLSLCTNSIAFKVGSIFVFKDEISPTSLVTKLNRNSPESEVSMPVLVTSNGSNTS